MEYIDVHCHLNTKDYGNLDDLIERITQKKVLRMICSAYDMETAEESARLADKYDNVYFCVGYQPQEIGKYRSGDLERIRVLARHEKCVAIGEIGLDYHYEENPEKAFQQVLFVQQLNLAHEENLPVIIHSRDCAEDMLKILTENRHLLSQGGMLHCYSHSAELLEEFSKLGLYFSFGGTATFENSRKVIKSVKRVSSERILSETDSPYLTPVPYRGQFPNTPENIPVIVEKLAQIREESTEILANHIIENAQRLFKKLK